MKKILEKIHEVASEVGHDVNLMEVCGTHTQAISRNGLRSLMPENVNLITGPGCPVCVTAQKDIDAIVSLALAGIPVATYGDLMRVPGSFGSLDQAREKGAKVFDVYSVQDALEIQKENLELVFFGLGFETTTPMTAFAIKKGLNVYSTHKLFLPAMKALLDMGEIQIDGFIDPGHVSVIIGSDAYESLSGVSQVITGFEAKDVLEGILMLLVQIRDGRKEIENQYVRAVTEKGNEKARKMIFDVFEMGDGDWRGFGMIPGSGLDIKKKYENQDAKKRHKKILDKIDFSGSKDPAGCACGEIIRGLKNPKQCPMFGRACTPENPTGPCMVSVEGACNVAMRFER
ncbi:MAG: hydrogenase formation protein HypD [Candidatus Moranbacteria bacterium]|nr:hydrogenase formation protein HypD [Candidatus Moranbacteria bacterium]